MVKRQKEKLYLSAREQRASASLRSGRNATGTSAGLQRRLPFNCCALSLNPFENPVILRGSGGKASAGVIFDAASIVPYVMRHGVDPITGTAASVRTDLIRLSMEKDEAGQWHCPVLGRPFGLRSKVVCVLQGEDGTANVYAGEAVEELNVRAKNWTDLISGKKFKREDIITLMDPDDVEHGKLRDINNFVHVKDRRLAYHPSENNTGDDGSTAEAKSISLSSSLTSAVPYVPSGNVRLNSTASRIMQKYTADLAKKKAAEADLKRKREAEEAAAKSAEEPAKNKRPRYPVVYTEDLVGGYRMNSVSATSGLTCTGMAVSRDMHNSSREATEAEILESTLVAVRRLKKKGYVRIETTLGNINVEIDCDIVPRTAANFLGLASSQKYDNSIFHRSIPDFMIQGGAPAGKTSGGESIWGGAFPDEFDDRLKHNGRGLLSMANAGPGTNKSQFFITYKSCGHLDRKHSVFGRVVGGMDVLRAMEDVPTNKKDRPRTEIKIIRTVVFVDPVRETEEAEVRRYEEKAREREMRAQEREIRTAGKNSVPGVTLGTIGVQDRKEVDALKTDADKMAKGNAGGSNRIGKYISIAKLQNIDEGMAAKKKF